MIFKKIFSNLLDHCCILCADNILESNLLCSFCWSKLFFLTEPQEFIVSNLNIKTHSVLMYNEYAKKIIQKFKYSKPWKFRKLIVNWFLVLYSNLFMICDVIIPVPSHKKKLITRGYNQTAILAQSIAKITKKKVLLNTLVKHRHTVSQSLLKRKEERIHNVINSFSINHKKAETLNNKTVLILDDVITTGATINECLKVILGTCTPKNIIIVSVARTLLE